MKSKLEIKRELIQSNPYIVNEIKTAVIRQSNGELNYVMFIEDDSDLIQVLVAEGTSYDVAFLTGKAGFMNNPSLVAIVDGVVAL